MWDIRLIIERFVIICYSLFDIPCWFSLSHSLSYTALSSEEALNCFYNSTHLQKTHNNGNYQNERSIKNGVASWYAWKGEKYVKCLSLIVDEKKIQNRELFSQNSMYQSWEGQIII